MQDFRIEVVGDKKQSFLSLLKELQLIVNDSIEIVVNHFNGANISKADGVAIIILKRLIESTKSGELLISKQFYRDASILVTNQIELRLDLQYISEDHTRAATWLTHTNQHRKPWRVSFLFDELFEGNELDAEKDVYKNFSMVKHGNPAADIFGFPFAIKDRQLQIDSNFDALLAKFTLYVFIFFGELYRTFLAGLVLFKKSGYDLKMQENKAKFLNYMMDDLNVSSVREQLQFLDQLGPLPEMCKSCSTVPENTIIIDCVLKRRNQVGKFTCENYKSKSNL
jgi:hypothetical protein